MLLFYLTQVTQQVPTPPPTPAGDPLIGQVLKQLVISNNQSCTIFDQIFRRTENHQVEMLCLAEQATIATQVATLALSGVESNREEIGSIRRKMEFESNRVDRLEARVERLEARVERLEADVHSSKIVLDNHAVDDDGSKYYNSWTPLAFYLLYH